MRWHEESRLWWKSARVGGVEIVENRGGALALTGRRRRVGEQTARAHAQRVVGSASDQVTQKPLEVLFMEKNHHLQNENISLKAKLTELQLG